MRLLLPAIIVYGVAAASAYSCLLPLWEGFDEAYHYGYVQLLSTTGRLPVLGSATLSQEIWHSFELVPVSHYLQPFTGAPITFSQYFGFAGSERSDLRRRLQSLPAPQKYARQTDKPDYEVNQSPLPYFFMAGIDRLLVNAPITIRVLALRLICSILAVLLIAHSTMLLANRLNLTAWYAYAALFCIFSSQMLYATICHVCNDWLAVPVMTYLLWAAVRAHDKPSRGSWFGLGLALAVGLLTKAYFLFLAPLVMVIVVWALWRKRAAISTAVWFLVPLMFLAAPWYLRNLLLYNNVSGTVESTSGLSIRQFFTAAVTLPWRTSIPYMAHTSLWTGNNSFTAFSAATLNIVLLLLAVGFGFNFVRKPDSPAWIVMAGIFLFSAGLAFITVAFFASSKGSATAAVPWYMQVLLPAVLLLTFRGLSEAPGWGFVVRAALIVFSAYLLAATFLAKLIPLYSGYPTARMHISPLWTWYRTSGDQRDAMLRTLLLASPSVLWALVTATIALGLVNCGRLLAATKRMR